VLAEEAPTPEVTGEGMTLLPQTVVNALMAEFRLCASNEAISLHRVRYGAGEDAIMDPAPNGSRERATIYVQEKDAELLRTLVEAGLRAYGINHSRYSKSKDTFFWHINTYLTKIDVEELVPSCMTRVIIPTAQ
jgi:hypothetical protein